MAHAQKPDSVFLRNGRVHLNRQGRPFSRILAAEVCASAVVMLDTTCPEVGWRVLATHSIRQFPLHFPSRAPPCILLWYLLKNNSYIISRYIHNTSVSIGYLKLQPQWQWHWHRQKKTRSQTYGVQYIQQPKIKISTRQQILSVYKKCRKKYEYC